MGGHERASPVAVLALGLGIIVLLGGMGLAAGGLNLAKHEGDTLHLADMVLRMAEFGQWPHLDFMTPIGVLAVAPIAGLVTLGLGIGHAVIVAQILLALLLLAAMLRTAESRLEGIWPWVVTGYTMILCLALVHGLSEPAVSVSMHYNRWAWAIAYVVVPLAILPPLGGARPWVDGVLIGLGMSVLALLKVTFFVGLAPAVIVALVARGEGRMILAALVTGLVPVVILTLLAGVGFWPAYIGDLLEVTHSAIRTDPGPDFVTVVAGPAGLLASLLALATVILLRSNGRMVEGLAVLVLTPGLYYITWQNFGNDPQWLVLMAAIAGMSAPEGGGRNTVGMGLRGSLGVLAVMALTLSAPSALNMAWSPMRHLSADLKTLTPMLPGRPRHDDLRIQEWRLYQVDAQVPLDTPGTPFASYAARAERPEPPVLNGETLPTCTLLTGYSAVYETMDREIVALTRPGARVLLADLLTGLWMFGDVAPVPRAAIWYYGGTPGLAQADYVAVPLCPTTELARSEFLKAAAAEGWRLVEVARTETMILLRPEKPGRAGSGRAAGGAGVAVPRPDPGPAAAARPAADTGSSGDMAPSGVEASGVETTETGASGPDLPATPAAPVPALPGLVAPEFPSRELVPPPGAQ